MEGDEPAADKRSREEQLRDALERLEQQPAEDLLHCLLWDFGRIGAEAALRGDSPTSKRMGLLAKVAVEMGAKAGLLSPEELSERRTACEAILGLIESPDLDSLVGGDPDELLRRMTGLEVPPAPKPTIWLPPRGIWRP